MARRIELGADALTIRYTGATALLVSTTEVRIPFSTIRAVRVGLDSVPAWYTFRVGLSTGPFTDHRRGRFWTGGKRLFLDLGDRRRALVLDLVGGPYDLVAIEPESDPEALAAQLRERRPETRLL